MDTRKGDDLTQGSISKHLVRLTLPLIAGNILQQLYNTIDAFVVARYAGIREFAAIGVAGAVMNLFLFAIAGACIGIAVLLLGEDSGPAFDDAVSYLRIIALFYILNFTGNTLAGYFDGVGRVSVTLLGTCTHIALRAVLCWIFISDFGLNAVAVLTGLGWILVNSIWAVFYYRQKDRK